MLMPGFISLPADIAVVFSVAIIGNEIENKKLKGNVHER